MYIDKKLDYRFTNKVLTKSGKYNFKLLSKLGFDISEYESSAYIDISKTFYFRAPNKNGYTKLTITVGPDIKDQTGKIIFYFLEYSDLSAFKENINTQLDSVILFLDSLVDKGYLEVDEKITKA